MLHSGWFHSALWPKWFHHIHIFIIIIIWITPYQYIYYHHAHQYVAWLFASLFVIFLSLRGEWTSIASNHLVLISSKSHINIMHWALSNGGNGGRFFLYCRFLCVFGFFVMFVMNMPEISCWWNSLRMQIFFYILHIYACLVRS